MHERIVSRIEFIQEFYISKCLPYILWRLLQASGKLLISHHNNLNQLDNIIILNILYLSPKNKRKQDDKETQ